MSIKYMTRVWQYSNQTGSALLLLLAIADNAGDNGWCFPGIEYLSEKTRLSTRQVIRLIQAIEKSGELTVMRGKGRKVVNKYHINIEKDGEIVCEKGDKMSPFSKDNVTEMPENVTSEQEKVTSTAIKGDIAMSRESSLTVLTSLTPKEGESEMIKDSDSDVVKEHKQRITKSLEKWAERNTSGIDVSGFPEELREVIRVFCELWDFKPPRQKSSRAYWIAGARDLLDSCDEFGMQAIREYHADFLALSKSNGKSPPIIASPQSLVNLVRMKAAELRAKGREVSQVKTNDLPPEHADLNRGRAWINNELYIDGKKAVKT